jgi:hypothetical protein
MSDEVVGNVVKPELTQTTSVKPIRNKKGVKKNTTAKKPRTARRDTITTETFLKTYATMAAEGKSAKEIGLALGRDSIYVLVKASQIRKAITEKTPEGELRTSRLSKVPSLVRGGGKMMDQIDSL